MALAIPRQLHAIWWQGLSALPPSGAAMMQYWQRAWPDWPVVFWDQGRLAQLIAGFAAPARQLWQEAWALAQHDIQRIDMAKWAILWGHGGVYADLDMLPLRDLAPLLDGCDFYLCQETRAPISWCNALIAAAPAHPLVAQLAAGHLGALRRPQPADRFTATMATTGPRALTDLLAALPATPPGARLDPTVEHLYPVPWEGRHALAASAPAALAQAHPQSVAVHLWAGLWKSPA